TLFHVADETSACPQCIVASTASVADQDKEVIETLVRDKSLTYVFDRGYINYHYYVQWALHMTLFVARIKANNKLPALSEKRQVASNSPVTLDQDVLCTDPQTGEKARLRLVEYMCQDKKGKLIRIRVVTNRFDLTAEEISEIYRHRWKIEMLFKWMKQHVNLKKLYNNKPRAVWNQIYLSLIAYALCE
ncbi:IS4 family transposase, partial [Paenibacillus marchantiophytorum]|uniref:IS4 family transposase n=1 Tax=Paenibacillus marchantiophytorum TaxID=1619310 RepID=UPI0016649C84